MDSEQRDDIPKRPKAVLAGHIVTKFVQVGAVAGVLTGIPNTLRKRRQMYSGQTALTHVERWALFNRFGRHVFTATMLGLAAGSIVAFAKVRNLDQTGIEDRAYRLKVIYNKNLFPSFMPLPLLIKKKCGVVISTMLVRGRWTRWVMWGRWLVDCCLPARGHLGLSPNTALRMCFLALWAVQPWVLVSLWPLAMRPTCWPPTWPNAGGLKSHQNKVDST